MTRAIATDDAHRNSVKPGGKVLALVGFLVLVGLAAGIGSQFMPDAWFSELQKPSFNPPDWVFGPVWSCLYALMAIAAWLVWLRAEFSGGRLALGLFGMQLALNVAWTPWFFGRHEIGWALIDIGLLWLAILATTVAFFRVRTSAGLLLLPYLAWVSFAAALNFAFWRLNG